jgi:phytoene dehydrogenase-like protein
MCPSIQHDAVIIGAGPNGLSAAIVLAQAGQSVLVLERDADIGGGSRSRELTLPGFVHDVCSAIHPLTVGSPYLKSLPLAQHGLEWVHPAAPLAHPIDDGTAVVLHRSIDETARGGGDAHDRAAWLRLMRPFVDGWDQLAEEILQPPMHVPKHVGVLARFTMIAARSASSIGRTRFRGARLRALFAGLAGHAMLPLDNIGSAAFGVMLGASGHAVNWPFPRGGAQRLTEAMASYFRSLGGEVETGRMIDDWAQLPSARAFLFDTSPLAMTRIAGDRLPARYQRGAKRYRYGMGVFKIDWALSEPIPWRAQECRLAGTLHLGGAMEEIERSERDAWNGRICERPFVLLAQHTLFDPSRAPAGRHTAWSYCHVPNGSTVDMTERIEAQVERFAPGFRDCILARHTMNSREMEAHNPNCIGGDINGGAVTPMQILFRPVARVNPYSTPDPSIFLCSASTPPGGGVHGMCGYHAAQTVLRRALREREKAAR